MTRKFEVIHGGRDGTPTNRPPVYRLVTDDCGTEWVEFAPTPATKPLKNLFDLLPERMRLDKAIAAGRVPAPRPEFTVVARQGVRR